MNSDIIYYYDDGILYDKNKVKVMDYDLSIKKEENRKHFANVDNTSEKEFKAEYEDRMTDVTELEEDIKNTDYIICNGNHCILDTNIFTPELIYNIYSDSAMRMPITLGTCVMNTDFISFSDGGVYGDSSFDIDGSLGNYELTEWLRSDDGDLIEGDTEYFDSAEDLSERIVSLGKLEVYDKEILHAIEKHINSKYKVNSEDAFNLDFDDVNVYGEKLTEAKQLYCCICGEPIEGYGNSPEPFMSSDEGRCCDGCNLKFVIPMRIDLMRNGE
jgi:hypothetical protein